MLLAEANFMLTPPPAVRPGSMMTAAGGYEGEEANNS